MCFVDDLRNYGYISKKTCNLLKRLSNQTVKYDATNWPLKCLAVSAANDKSYRHFSDNGDNVGN